MKIKRRKTRQVKVGNVKIGGGAPISIQSMTKTDTKNAPKTIAEIKKLEKTGCEIVRVAIKDKEAAESFGKIKRAVNIPVVADIHFNVKLALMAIASGADAIRLNPGNIRRKDELAQVIRAAARRRIPLRIGVNSGSLKTPTLMVKAVLNYLKIFEGEKFRDIIISLKSSGVTETIEANKRLALLCGYPIHLGVTASGLPREGIIKSAIAIGSLLLDGIGDTIRVSLTADPCEEVQAARSILQSMGLRRFGPEIISCPTCGRCGVDLIEIVKKTENAIRNTHSALQNRPLTLAIMGCEVNGPGEARNADIGIAAGKGAGVLFKKGKIVKRIREKDFVNEIINAVKLRAEG